MEGQPIAEQITTTVPMTTENITTVPVEVPVTSDVLTEPKLMDIKLEKIDMNSTYQYLEMLRVVPTVYTQVGPEDREKISQLIMKIIAKLDESL